MPFEGALLAERQVLFLLAAGLDWNQLVKQKNEAYGGSVKYSLKYSYIYI